MMMRADAPAVRRRIGRGLAALLLVATAVAIGDAARAQSSDDGFAAFLEALSAAGQTVRDNTPEGDGPERAEGYRHVIRLVEFAQSRFLDDADAAHPNVARCPSRVCKIGFDSPDQVYVGVTPISDRYTYRVFGQRGTVDFMAFQVFDNPYGGPSALDSDDLEVNPDGSWELFLGPEPQPGNWLPTTPTSTQLVIRLTFADWEREIEGSVQVEVVGGADGSPVTPLAPADFAARARTLATTIQATPALFQQLRCERYPVNDFVDPDPEAFGLDGAGLQTNLVSPAQYDIAPDQALVVESADIPVRFRNIQLGNLWLESLDYASRQTSLNGLQSYRDPDGVYRFVLAHVDPGVPNWLDVGGHPRGTIFMRWNKPQGGDAPKPTTYLVPLAELRSHLPAGHPRVTPEERAATLERRRQAYNRRTNPAGLALGLMHPRRQPARLPRLVAAP
jgi:hypothetical protein